MHKQKGGLEPHLCGGYAAVPQHLRDQAAHERLALVGWPVQLRDAHAVAHGKHLCPVLREAEDVARRASCRPHTQRQSWQTTLATPSTPCKAARVRPEQALHLQRLQPATLGSVRAQGASSLRLGGLAGTRARSGASRQAAQGFPPGACRHSLLATPRPEKQGRTATGAAGAAGRAAQPPTAALIAVMLKAMAPVFARSTHPASLATFFSLAQRLAITSQDRPSAGGFAALQLLLECKLAGVLD